MDMSFLTRKHYIFSVFALTAIGLGVLTFPASNPEKKAIPAARQKGVCWVGGRTPVTQVEFDALKKCGVTWISQTPFGWQKAIDDPVIEFEKEGQRIMWGESKEGLRITTALANSNAVKVMLKPHLWARGGWPGDIDMQSEKDWENWFSQYSDFITYYARLAEENNISILCIGTELNHATEFEARWRQLIRDIREVYHGKLTYAANFHEEYQHIKFWDQLDYIGIQAYFPLSTGENPSTGDLVRAWEGPLADLERIYKVYKKPVVFTEIGYRSTSDTAIEPWKWPQHSDESKISDETQANCYEAFFQAAWDKSWLEGVYFWKWYPQGNSRIQDIDFTPQGKPAEVIMANWFTKNNK
jgi:Glycoside Hydrolase Family 113